MFFSTMLLITGCLPDPLEVENIPDLEETVVIGSQDLPGQFLAVSVTKNFNALAAGPDSDVEALLEELAIDTLSLQVEVRGQQYPLVAIDSLPGLYVGTNVPEFVNEEYTLNFTHPINKKEVRAHSYLMPFVGFDSLSIDLKLTPFDTLFRVSLQIDDPPGKNWYLINLQEFNEDYDIQRLPYTELIEDDDEAAKRIKHEFIVPFRDYRQGDTVLVSMANISQEYFEFRSLRKDQRYIFIENLGEPITYPSNVENGLGFFNTHLPDVRLFLLEP